MRKWNPTSPFGAELVLTSTLSQFGNMLVLAATYNSDIPELSSLVHREELRGLLTRTINFLQYSQDVSPTLRHDAYILETIHDRLFPPSASFTCSN